MFRLTMTPPEQIGPFRKLFTPFRPCRRSRRGSETIETKRDALAWFSTGTVAR